MSLKRYANKDTFNGVIWIILIAAVLIFFKHLMSGLYSIFGLKKSDNELKTEAQQKEYINRELDKVRSTYGKNGIKSKDYYVNVANVLEQKFNAFITPWSEIERLIAPLSDVDLWLVYLQFGSRQNTEYLNMQGDLYDWVVKEWQVPSSFFMSKNYGRNILARFVRLKTKNPKFVQIF